MTDARNLSDRELLVLTHSLVEEIKYTLEGNGSPGLKSRVTVLETKVDERTSPSRAAVVGLSAGVVVFLAAVTEAIKAALKT